MAAVQIITLLLAMATALGVLFLIMRRRIFLRTPYWNDRYFRWDPYYDELIEIIRRAERESHIELTWTAREILLLTYIERLQAGASPYEVRESILAVLQAMAQ